MYWNQVDKLCCYYSNSVFVIPDLTWSEICRTHREVDNSYASSRNCWLSLPRMLNVERSCTVCCKIFVQFSVPKYISVHMQPCLASDKLGLGISSKFESRTSFWNKFWKPFAWLFDFDSINNLHVTRVTSAHITQCVSQFVHDTPRIWVNRPWVGFIQKTIIICGICVDAFCIRVVQIRSFYILNIDYRC